MTNGTSVQVIVLGSLIVVAIGAVSALQLFGGAAAEIAPTVGLLAGILLPAVAALMALIQASAARRAAEGAKGAVKEVHEDINGRMSATITASTKAALAHGFNIGVQTDPASPNAMRVGIAEMQAEGARVSHEQKELSAKIAETKNVPEVEKKALDGA